MSTKSIMRCCILSLSILLVFSVLPAAAEYQPGVIEGCVQEVGGINNASCTANDVRLTSIVPGSLQISEGCNGTGNWCFVTSTGANTGVACTVPDKTQGTCSAGQLCIDTVTFSATGQFQTGPSQRYDIGLYMETGIDSLDSHGNYEGARAGQCERFAFINDPPDLPNVDGDTCADIRSSATVPVDFGPVTIPCVDTQTANPSDPGKPIPGSDGLVDINHCETWGNGANEVPSQNQNCYNSTDVRAGTGAKCFCGLLSGACIAIPDNNLCTLDICQGNCQPAGGTGGSNTPCVDNTVCTAPGETCFNIHLQHIDESATLCPPDAYFCADNACDEETGECVQTDKSAAVCPPGAFYCADNACDEALNKCVQTDKSATVCPPGAFFCADNTCSEALDKCVQTDKSATVCPDTLCQICDETANACADKDPLPAECLPGVATCRTPGFWGTHAGVEKNASVNITQQVITDCGGCLSICGESVTNTDLQNASSAVEAICVSVAADIRLQLARQLTAASLNCCVSGAGSDCAGLPSPNEQPSWYEVFAFCNDACADGITEDTQVCIDALDCLNNGGNIVGVVDSKVQCQTGTCQPALDGPISCGENLPACPTETACEDLTNTCHTAVLGICADGSICTTANTTLVANDKPICNSDDSVCKPGSAGSSNECNLATGDINKKNTNNCAILPVLNSTADCSKFNQGETCCTNPGVITCDVVDLVD